MKQLNWYVTNLIVECRVGRARAELWDEQIVMLRARGAEDAYLAAVRLGREQDTTYKNSTGDTVRWKFKGLGDLKELGSKTIRSGTEVYSRLSRSKRPYIPRKRKLTVFWAERNLQKTANELLGDKLRPFAPR